MKLLGEKTVEIPPEANGKKRLYHDMELFRKTHTA